MKIIFPEFRKLSCKSEIMAQFPGVEFLNANDLDMAVTMLKEGVAASMISGFNFSSREVLLAYKKHLNLSSRFFSSCFIMEKDDGLITHFALADGGVCKNPDVEQLYTIVEDTAKTFYDYYREQPRIAMLSYSTNGSGGKNPDLEKIRAVIARTRLEHPEYEIDGEMQLDAAVNPEVGLKKFPASGVAGRANVLIVPDLNSGNILYKGLARLGGWTAAGPMIQGFTMPLADLSRGSTSADIILTLKVLVKLLEKRK